MQQFTIRLPAPTAAQEKVAASKTRFNVVSMGEDAGKTSLGIDLLITAKDGVISGNAPVAWFSADSDRLAFVRSEIRRLIAPHIKRQVNARRMEMVNGNMLDLYSADSMPKTFPQYGLIIVDDAAEFPRIEELATECLLEMLRIHRGRAWFLSRPLGKKNEFYSLYQRGFELTDWSSWQFSSKSNRKLPRETQEEIDRATEEEYLRRFSGEFLDGLIQLNSAQTIILPGESFLQWCRRLANDGLLVDGRPFSVDDRPAMAWIYDQIPSTTEEAFNKTLVLMKCAQVGFTVMEMLAVIYLGLKFSPATVGMFLPDMRLAGIKSSERFLPIVKTIPSVYAMIGGEKGGDGNINTRRIGSALFVFSWTSGRATTESIPMDILSFDEVQEMTKSQLEKTKERLSASKVRFTLMGSTANWPDEDIHHWYKKGTQHQFHTRCPHCGSSKPLDDYFPDCIRFDNEKRRHRYVCHSCQGWIDDSQAGEWIPLEPDNGTGEQPIISVHFPQYLSPSISPGEIMSAYNSATDMKSFYNRKRGKPYLDPSQVPVNLEHLRRCVDIGVQAGLVWKSRDNGCYMGIDQMGNFNVHVIKKRMPDGRQAVVHIEETYSEDPFARSSELMNLYGVSVCVVEINPNYNDAKKFALRHPGRVFICNSFGAVADGMIQWGDTPKMDKSDRKTDTEAQDRYTLRMDQFKCMQVSMSRFHSNPPSCLFPDDQGLVQEVVEKGIRQNVAILPRMFNHLTKTALVAEKDSETNKFRRSVKKVGIDPHFSYANMLCDVAWSRSHGTSTFILPEERKAADGSVSVSNVVSEVFDAITTSTQTDTCGACISYDQDSGMCKDNLMRVKAADPGCWQFIPTYAG